MDPQQNAGVTYKETRTFRCSRVTNVIAQFFQEKWTTRCHLILLILWGVWCYKNTVLSVLLDASIGLLDLVYTCLAKTE